MHTPQRAVTDPKALQSIMFSLQRLMKIGIYYPPGHSVLERAINTFRQNLVKVAGDNLFIRFSIRDGKLYLQDIPLDEKHFFTREFQETLAGLTIKNLDIDREILPEEIRQFISSLLVYRSKYRAAKGFARIHLEELPFSVRISQTQYLATEVDDQMDGTPGDATQPTLEVLLESLQKQDLTPKQVDQCRHLLEGISLQPMLVALEPDGPAPLITWADVERLIIKLVKKSEDEQSPESTKSQQDINALASILTSIGEKTTNKSSLEAIDLLVSLVKKESTEPHAAPSGNKPNEEDTADEEKIADIKSFLADHSPSQPSSRDLITRDNRETLTIVLQLLRQKYSLQILYRLQQMLREILTADLEQGEWEVLVNGILLLIKETEDAYLSVIMTMLIDPVRRSENASSLSLLAKASGRCDLAQLKRVLPYIINELLIVGRQDDPTAFDKLCKKILYLPSENIKATLPTLQKLDSFAHENIAQSLFFAMPKENLPLFAPLFTTSLESTLHKRIFHAFRSSAPDWFIKALLPFIRERSSLTRQLFNEYLKESGPAEPTPKLRAIAGKIVVGGLPAVSEEKRQSPELVKSIKAIPQFRDEHLRQVLESIINQRHLLIIPQWPPTCRKAAREALSKIAKSRRTR